MLPIAGDHPPLNTAELTSALKAGLAKHGVSADVNAEGEMPQLKSLSIKLDQVSRPKPTAKAVADRSLQMESLRIEGSPVLVEAVPFTLDAQLSGVAGGFGRVEGEGWQLVASDARDGSLVLEVSVRDLQNGIHLTISALASKQGATVKETKVRLSSPNPRSIQFEVDCTAKVFIATATLSVTGRVDIDDTLNARISGLSVKGDGMVANMAKGYLEPEIAKWNGKVIPLGDYVTAGLKVTDLKISAGEKARIEAKFGSSR